MLILLNVVAAFLLGSTPTKSELAAIASANAGRLTSVKMSWVERQEVLSGSWQGNALIEEMRQEITCDLDFHRFLYSGAMRRSGETEMGPLRTLATDGSGTYWEYFGIRASGAAPPRGAGTLGPKTSIERNNIAPLHSAMLFSQIPGSTQGADGCILSLIDQGEIAGEEQVDADDCAILEFKHQEKTAMRYWLALKKGCVPVRAEMYNAAGGVASRVDSVVESFEGPDGEQVWLPVSLITNTTLRGGPQCAGP